MTDETVQPIKSSKPVARRTIITAAAWSVPVITLAASAPAAASSVTPVCRNVTYPAPAPASTGRLGFNSTSTDFTVPAGVRSINFRVAGGAGGGSGGAGSGALVTGTLAVTPGEVLTLIVGQGGWRDSRPSGTITRPAVEGGHGYGNGGNIVEVNRLNDNGALRGTAQGGSGGGGSAILSSTTPLVVAGGGGGTGSGIYEVEDWSPTTSAVGGNGGQPASAVANRLDRIGNNAWISGGRGLGGSGATAGAGGTGATNIGAANSASGSNGSGRNGGLGQLIGIGGGQPNANGAVVIGVTSGGGGGGYAGGGAGGRASFSNAETKAALGGPGGGGSNFISTRVGGGQNALANNSGGAGDVRNPGWITLTYQVCT